MDINGFLNFLKYEKRCSVHTLTAYHNDLIQFETFIKEEIELRLTEVKPTHIKSFMAHCLEKELTANALGRKLSALRSFYRYLMVEGVINQNPMVLIKAPKTPKKIPVFVEDTKMVQLLSSETVFDEGFPGQRDKLVLELLFGTGMRLAELIQLKALDVNFFENTVKVLGKRNKERIIPMHAALVNQIKVYQASKSLQNFDNKSDYLIVTNNGQQAYAKLIYRIVTSYLNLVSTQDKKSPHVLRHSFASSLLNKGADLNSIKELLGHANLAATQIYTHTTIERLKSIYKQAHPKA